MNKVFQNWKDAHVYAAELATALGRDVGIEKGDEFGIEIFRTFPLPSKEHRCGHELRCEVVTPGTPG